MFAEWFGLHLEKRLHRVYLVARPQLFTSYNSISSSRCFFFFFFVHTNVVSTRWLMTQT